jgi:hypothetical protein
MFKKTIIAGLAATAILSGMTMVSAAASTAVEQRANHGERLSIASGFFSEISGEFSSEPSPVGVFQEELQVAFMGKIASMISGKIVRGSRSIAGGGTNLRRPAEAFTGTAANRGSVQSSREINRSNSRDKNDR